MSDIFKKSFLEGYGNAEITTETVLTALFCTLLISLFIFIVYRVTTRKTFYSRNFNISLVGVALVTAAIIVTIQSSIVVSLGMVGALSIVRFRTAIKDPLDLLFLFWAISVGIICGAGFAVFAVVLTAVVTLAVIFLNKIPVVKAPMILVISSTNIDSEDIIIGKVRECSKHYSIKARNLTSDSLDLTIELRTDKSGELVRSLIDVEGVVSANILEHDGEATL